MITYNPKIKPKNRHIQSILASSKIRLLRLKTNNPIATNTRPVLVTTSNAQLQGFISRNKDAKDLYVLLHGWEGSAQSTYIQLLAKSLYVDKKASIFRLNFRDHGETHHLNSGLFHSCRLQEVVESIKQVTERYPHDNVILCGFSLGGNFALRVAAKAYACKIKLKKVFSISPPLKPKNSMLAIERSKLYSKYFIKKWKRSLIKKQKIYPKLFENHLFTKTKSLQELTENLILKHTDYKTTEEYFKGYEITGKIIADIRTPCHVITSWDDPVIPFTDFKEIEGKTNIRLITTKHGGHCGFINSWKMHSWIEHYIIANS